MLEDTNNAFTHDPGMPLDGAQYRHARRRTERLPDDALPGPEDIFTADERRLHLLVEQLTLADGLGMPESRAALRRAGWTPEQWKLCLLAYNNGLARTMGLDRLRAVAAEAAPAMPRAGHA